MSDTEEPTKYVTVKDDGTIILEADAHIDSENFDIMKFSFDEPKDITESVAKKNAKNKIPVSRTNNGRSAYAPLITKYPDGSTSSKIVLEKCIIQYNDAMNAATYTYAKEFALFGLTEEVIGYMISQAYENSKMNLRTKANVERLEGCYWFRCNLEKLGPNSVKIVTEQNTVPTTIEKVLKAQKCSLVANVTFTISASMNNNDMNEELDLADGIYTITAKPTDIVIVDTSDVQGPKLKDTNARIREVPSTSMNSLAKGSILEFAARQIKLMRK